MSETVHFRADEIVLGLRMIMDEADGPILPTTVRPTTNVQGNGHAAHMFVDYGPGERFLLALIRVSE